jgi:hypothetical protein
MGLLKVYKLGRIFIFLICYLLMTFSFPVIGQEGYIEVEGDIISLLYFYMHVGQCWQCKF